MIALAQKSYDQEYYEKNIDKRRKASTDYRRKVAAKKDRLYLRLPDDVMCDLDPIKQLTTAILFQMIRDARGYLRKGGKQELGDGLDVERVKEIFEYYDIDANPGRIVSVCEKGTLYEKIEKRVF